MNDAAKKIFPDPRDWVGKSTTSTELATAAPIARIAATFGMAPPAVRDGDALPPGWHTAYFTPLHGPDRMRADGSAGAGALAPPIPLARQRVGLDHAEYPGEIRLGDQMTRTSRLAGLEILEAPTGTVAKQLIRNEITTSRGLAVVEIREMILYDENRPPDAPLPPLPQAVWKKTVTPDPILLFRFSAVRFNSHRVHYDRDFALGEEGLPGLIVQASLLSFMMSEMCRNEMKGRALKVFKPRTRHPVYDTGPFTLCGAPDAGGRSATLWVIDPEGATAMIATAEFA
jgi:3-methylfumaryl-CoA hydratase